MTLSHLTIAVSLSAWPILLVSKTFMYYLNVCICSSLIRMYQILSHFMTSIRNVPFLLKREYIRIFLQFTS